jgi:hypothetical protein
MGGFLVGSNLAAHWGSVGYFGPLTVRPDLWDRGVGKRLMEPIMNLFERWGTRHVGLFTFSSSPKHHSLYQRYGFCPRYLTMIMTRTVEPAALTETGGEGWTRLGEVPATERESVLTACRGLTGALYEGLDLSIEIRSLAAQGIGETLLLWDGSELAGMAVCHMGAGSEAGSNTLYVKFAAARAAPDGAHDFARLIGAIEHLAVQRGLGQVVAGVNTSHQTAYHHLLSRGYRIASEGVTMHKGPDLGYHRPDLFVLDDWR